MTPVTDPLAVFPPVPVELRLADQTLRITPLVLGELPAFAQAVQPMVAELAGEPDWLRLLGRHGEPLIDALAIASRQPRDWVTALAIDDAIALAQALFEVNADFFIQRVVPRIAGVADAVSRLGQSAGPTPASG